MFSPCVPNLRTLQLCVLAALLLALPTGHAQEIYDYVPEDAYGFVTINNLDDLNGKVKRIAELFKIPMPAPLDFLNMATGLDEGLDKTGSTVIAVLPSDLANQPVEPMLLLPITDYSKFANSLSGDASGKICRVAIAGNDVLLAKKDNYALLMDVTNQETMEIFLAAQASEVAALKPISPWLTNNDLNITIMPKGLGFLLSKGNEALTEQKRNMEEQFGNSPLLENMRMSMNMYQWILDFFDAEVKLASWGLRIDEKLNLFIGKRLILNENGVLSQASQTELPKPPIFKAFNDEAFVVAAGGPWPESWADKLVSGSVNLMKSMKSLYGLDDLPDEEWDKLSQSYSKMTKGMRGFSMLMLPGEEKEPLLGTIFGVMHTTNSTVMIEQFKKGIEQYNEIMGQSKTFKMKYEFSDLEVAGKKGFEFSIDMAEMFRDPNVPGFNWMLEGLFGEDGKMNYTYVAADRQNIVYGMTNEDSLTQFIENLGSSDQSLKNNEEVQVTLQLLPQQAPWKILVSPPGCVKWVKRFVSRFLTVLTGQDLPIPDFPACPPVGFSMAIQGTTLEADMVVPSQTLKAIANYIETCKQL